MRPDEPTPPVSLWPEPEALGPVTDLYQLTMMAGYRAQGMGHERAVFEVFVRRLPAGRSFLVWAGLEQAIGDVLRLRFAPAQIQAIRALPAFGSIGPEFFDWLADLRFSGDIWAMPEGSVAFAGETLLRVEAPLPEAQWVETFLLASLGYPTLVASKAARIVLAAEGRAAVEFGLRRGHGPMAGILAARAAYVAGFVGTSNVDASLRLGIPCYGTMAHAWVQAFDTEREAFEAYARTFPDATTLLVDTYDTLEGVRTAAAIEPPIRAVRLDSGDLAALARGSRQILDEAGRSDVTIFASSDLDEHAIARFVADGVPIDAFGVGTELVTSRDAPALSMVYKLVAVDGQGRVKLAPGKRTYPLAKQVWRRFDADGRMAGDHVTAADEPSDGTPLLRPVVRQGRLVEGALPPMSVLRDHCAAELQSLPDPLRRLDDPPAPYPVTYSDRLESEARRLGLRPVAPG
jgi:nicotinate phosphoribosyltransferase